MASAGHTYISRTQPVDIYSKARVSGTPSSFTITLPEDACKALEGEIGIEVEVTSVQMLNCVTPIQNSNDSWLLVDTVTGAAQRCTLPHVNASLKTLANAVQGALPFGWAVTANEATNKLMFTAPSSLPNPVKFVFNDVSLQVSSNGLLGFSKLAVPTFSAGSTITSDVSCDVGGPATVLVVMDLPTPSQAINIFGQVIGASVVQKIPLCCPFMSLMNHRDTSGTWAVQLPPMNLNQIAVGLLTEDLLPLHMDLDWSMTVKVSYFTQSPLVDAVRLLEGIENFSEMTFLKHKWTQEDQRQRKRIAAEAQRVLENL